MKVYCVMEKDVYDCTGNVPDALYGVWLSKERAKMIAKSLDEEFEPYEHYVREEEVREEKENKKMTREEAIEYLQANMPDPYYEKLREAVQIAIETLKRPEPKTGHWIFCEGIKGKDNVEKCSCCQSHWKEAVIYRNDTQEYLRTRLLYCPNCGAKMEAEEHEV